ncbi:MAG: 50S ribosomal protein L13 [Candidatus Algichlamydia australiensis]|nr:50S ribosomal protein L13 [Chlamydiales bacterium]
MANTRNNQTIFITAEEAQKNHNWFVVDAAGKTLGRFASEVAKILRGKHKATFTPHVDCGDGIVILNAEKITLTGSKPARKTYKYHTGHVGGLREVTYATMHERKPDYILRHAIQKMMPRTKLGRAQLKRLRIFVGEEHNLQAQQPVKINL